MLRTPAAALLLLTSGLVCQPSPPSKLDRVVAIGASLTAGFGTQLTPGALLDRAIEGSHRPVATDASALFFTDPDGHAKRQIEALAGRRPTLVLAVDFLFWFGYGSVLTAEEVAAAREAGRPPAESDAHRARRLARLERGLRWLEKIDAPLLIADIPDMRGTKIVPPVSIPSPAALKLLNARIAQWAAQRDSVRVLALTRLVRDMNAGKITLPGREADAASRLSAEQVLLPDRLHPTKAGAVVLCAHVLEALKPLLEPDDRSRLQLDADALLAQHLPAEEQADERPARSGAGKVGR